MKTQDILIIDTVHPLIKQRLGEHFSIQEDYLSPSNELQLKLKDIYGIILRSRVNLNAEMIDAAPKLKFIARLGAGMESIDVEHARSKGIICLNSPEGNRDAVAEHTMGMLLSLTNNLNRADREVRAGIWEREKNRGMEIKDKCVGILGYGNMGAAFAERLRGFGCRVISYDKNKTGFSNELIEEVSYEEFFAFSQIVSIHIPLDEDNFYLINASWFQKFKNPIILLNTSRGYILKTSDLVSALETNKVLAAGLDVLEYEESSFEYTRQLDEYACFKKLSRMDNVIFSPHIAGWTRESKIKLAEVLVDKILAIK
jgi:D-3-phosphoglycerate dehydrogenase / 2-oxoglutarate reductase